MSPSIRSRQMDAVLLSSPSPVLSGSLVTKFRTEQARHKVNTHTYRGGEREKEEKMLPTALVLQAWGHIQELSKIIKTNFNCPV